MMVGAPRRDGLKIKVYRYIGNTTVTVGVGVSMVRSAERKRTMKCDITGKENGLDWR